jgi:hypothetical protein
MIPDLPTWSIPVAMWFGGFGFGWLARALYHDLRDRRRPPPF